MVTGVAGFIGSHLAEHLLKLGLRVVGIDDFSTGFRENLLHLTKFPKFHFFQSDCLNLNELSINSIHINVIFHQAAWGSVPRSLQDPTGVLQNNVGSFQQILEFARENKVKRVIYASSSSVYGDSQAPIKFVGREGSLLSPYALSKSMGEQLANLYTRIYGVETIGLRYFNVFGSRQNPNGMYSAVIPKWIKLMENNEDCEVYGDGMQSRDFTYINDVVQANVRAAVENHPKSIGSVYNVGTGNPTQLLTVFDILKAKMFSKSELRFLPERKGDVRNSRSSISRALGEIGYSAKWNIDTGIGDMLDVTTLKEAVV